MEDEERETPYRPGLLAGIILVGVRRGGRTSSPAPLPHDGPTTGVDGWSMREGPMVQVKKFGKNTIQTEVDRWSAAGFGEDFVQQHSS